jgi:hypothetical protein
MLHRQGHTWWTADNAHLAGDKDDVLTGYADDHRAVLVTFDREFTQRRRRNSIGQHVKLRCVEPQAAAVLETHLDEVVELLRGREHVTIKVSKDGVVPDSDWQ